MPRTDSGVATMEPAVYARALVSEHIYPDSMRTITPYLLYEDVAGAVAWLVEAFGFEEILRYSEPDGEVIHAELRHGDARLMLGDPGEEYRNPLRIGHVSQYVYVLVDDVDAHFERARAAGARILLEPTDQEYGDRRYDVEDCEGHRWMFAQRMRDLRPEDWGAVRKGTR